jgi:hypothetical protein
MARRLRAGEAALTLRILGVAAIVPLVTRLGLARQARILEPRREPRPDPARAEWLAANVDRILAAGRPVVRPGCLTRRLTHYYFLRRLGADVALAFGVGQVDGSMEGHCWLARDGEPCLDRGDPRAHFVETYVVSRASAT